MAIDMKKVFLLMIMLLGMSTITMRGESPEEVEKAMDDIKLSGKYLYGQSYADTLDIAYGRALFELLTQINAARQEAGKSELRANEIDGILKKLKYTTDYTCAVMVYCDRDKALAFTGRPRIEGISGASDKSPAIAEKSPAIVDTPPAREPSIARTAPVQESSAVVTTDKSPASALPTRGMLEDVAGIIAGQDNWIEIQPMLVRYKKEGKYSLNATVERLSEVPDDAYAILMDSNGGVIAVMGPEKGGGRKNYKTNRIEDMTDYPNIRIILWLK